MLSLVDLSGRTSVQESLLPIQVEETTTSTTVRVAQNAATTKTSATQEASTAENCGHSHRQAQENEEENRVAAEEGSRIEEESLQSTDSGLRGQLGRGGNDKRDGLKN